MVDKAFKKIRKTLVCKYNKSIQKYRPKYAIPSFCERSVSVKHEFIYPLLSILAMHSYVISSKQLVVLNNLIKKVKTVNKVKTVKKVKTGIPLALAVWCVSMLSASKHSSYGVVKGILAQDPCNELLKTGKYSSLHFYYLHYMSVHHWQMFNLEHHNKLRKQTEINLGHMNVDVI